jgi:predicted small metal-binding protein
VDNRSDRERTNEEAEMKEFSCSAVVPGCTATITAETEQQLLEQVAAHAKDEHGMDEVPDEVVAKVRENVREV